MTDKNWLKDFIASERPDKLIVVCLTAGAVLLLITGLFGLKTHSMLAVLMLVVDAVFFHKIYKIASRKI